MDILVADDEKIACEQLIRAIEEVVPGERLAAFTNPKEALEYGREHPCDVAFLDVEMGELSGIAVAKQLKLWHPAVNIVFVTAYDQYMAEAIQLRMSGYVGKPVTAEKIREELDNLRNPVISIPKGVLVAKCFGTFDAFVDGRSLEFERSKTREMLAYLIDRRGNSVTSGELRAVLWEDVETDRNTGVYLQKLKKDLNTTLKKAGVAKAFVTTYNRYAIDPDYISCDYYDYLENKPSGIRAYNGEYMSQYSWGDLKEAIVIKK